MDILPSLKKSPRFCPHPQTVVSIHAPARGATYRIWPTHRLPRKRVVQAAKRRFERISREHAEGRAGFDDVRAVVVSFLGYMQHCKGKRSADSALKRMLLRRR